MMKLHELRPDVGAKKRGRRVGRGISAGQGKTAGRGTKGQKSRSGGTPGPAFRGTTYRAQRMPFLRGVGNRFRYGKVEHAEVNVGRLASFDEGSEVTPEAMVKAGLIRSTRKPVKILGEGALPHALTVRAHAFSAGAAAKIKAVGGKAEVLAWE